jgi:PmbA protein
MTDYLELARDIARRAAVRGVEAEAIIMDEQETKVRVDRGTVEQLAQSGSRGLGVRVIDRGRVGYGYTSDFRPGNIDDTWQAAAALARVASADEHRSLPDPQPIPEEDLEIWDPELPRVTVEQKIALAQQVEEAALACDPRVAMTNRCTYQDSIAHVYLANSRGFAGAYSRTTAFAYVIGIGRDEDGQTMAFGVDASNHFHDLDAQAIGQEAGLGAVQLLGGRPVETQIGTVVLDPMVTGSVLAVISQALTAESVQRGRSFLAGRMGQEVGCDKVSLLDNGRLKRGLASAPFDGEGVPTSATRLIDEGILQQAIHDSYTARKEGIASTGNAQRGSHRSLPVLGPSNFYLQPGTQSEAEIIAGVERGLYVTRIMQVGGINPVNGDCSMGASGLWIENGQVGRPISGVTIATTLPDLLQNIVAVGKDLRVVPFAGAIGATALRVDGVTIGGTAAQPT